MFSRGDRVDRFVVERPLGEGGMARVYLVRHAELGTLHALKVLTVRSPDLDGRFLREGRVQARMRHPNIVPVTDVLQLDRGPALVMDWVAGPTLDRLLDPCGLAIDDALGVFRALVHAVGYAHLRGTIHRDLKPENVIIEIGRHGLVPRIADFGLARALDEPAETRRTRTGVAMGTPTYMAPEQMKDASRCDERADLYALGVMLYELVAGMAPYIGSDLVTVALAHVERPHAPLAKVRPEVPQWLSDLADALLAQDPDDRPASCVEVLGRVERRAADRDELAEGAPPLTGELVEVARATWTDPRPTLGAVPVAPTPVPPTEEVPPAPAPRRRRLTLVGIAGLTGLTGLTLLLGAVGAVWAFSRSELAASVEVERAPAALVAPPVEPRTVAPEPVEPVEAAPEGEAEAPVAAPAPPAPPEATAARSPVPARSAPAAVAPPPAEPAAPAITFRVEGDAERVWLTRDGRVSWPGDALSPGSYVIRAVFDGGPPTDAGTLTVVTGDAPVVACVAGFQRCARR